MTAIIRPDGANTRATRQRQREFVDQSGQRRPRGRPFQHALRRRHKGDAALAILAEQAEIGRGVADAEHPLTLGIRPARLDAAIDQPPRHDAEALRIEIAEVDHVDGHVSNLSRQNRTARAEYRLAELALTP